MASWLKRKLFGPPQFPAIDEDENVVSFKYDEVWTDDLATTSKAKQTTDPPQKKAKPRISGGASCTPGDQEMSDAYKVSNMLVRERLERENPEDVSILDSIKDSDIICVKGTFDHIHLVLEAIGIPFLHVEPHTLLSMDLTPDQTVYVNCPKMFPKEAALRLREFVKDGGQLITTDWALRNVLEVAFPGTVRFSGHKTGDEVVAVEIVDKSDEILKGFLDQETDAAPVWWLERSSYPIEILDRWKVKVLVRSEELKRRYKHDPVIVSFEWGKGVVYHMISHFYLQRTETRTQKQGMSSTAYAEAQGASAATKAMFDQVNLTSPGLNYGMVQSASTSSEFVSRCVVRQKKKYSKRISSEYN